MLSPDSDRIEIEDLSLRAVIGIFDHERDRRQELSMSLTLATDVRRAAATDAIDDAVDYKSVTKRIIDFVEASQFFLLETLAEQVAQLIFDEFDIDAVRLRVDKPGALRHARTVGVAITRYRHAPDAQ